MSLNLLWSLSTQNEISKQQLHSLYIILLQFCINLVIHYSIRLFAYMFGTQTPTLDEFWGISGYWKVLLTSRVYPALHGICAVLRRASSTWQIHLMYIFNLDTPFFDSFSSRQPMIKKEKSDHPKTISNRLGHFRFLDSFSSREPMIKKEKSDHPETISNRFLLSKLVYRMIFD